MQRTFLRTVGNVAAATHVQHFSKKKKKTRSQADPKADLREKSWRLVRLTLTLTFVLLHRQCI